MKETGGPVLHEVVSGSDTSLRDKVEQMYRKAGSVKQPEGTWWARFDEEFDRCWAQHFQPYQPQQAFTRRQVHPPATSSGSPPTGHAAASAYAAHRPTR